jgi:hypothetical protein
MLKVILWVCLLSAMSIGLLSQGLLAVTLRQHFPKYFQRLGSPPSLPLLPSDPLGIVSFYLYILFGRYQGAVPEETLGHFRFVRGMHVAQVLFGIALLGVAVYAT